MNPKATALLNRFTPAEIAERCVMAEAELAKLNYIELPNENVSNVFEAYLAWKSKAAQLEAEVKELQEDIKRLSELIDECDGWSGNLGA